MEAKFDEAKRLKILSERGLDLQDAEQVFEGFNLRRRDHRHDYGEERFITLGLVNGEVVKVVWTERDGQRRIITMWKARHGEREEYRRLRDELG